VQYTEAFGRFMHHTPFYQFPYLAYLALFWATLCQVLGFLSRRRSLGEAVLGGGSLGSCGLLMILVCGMVTTLGFGQMALLSLPILGLFGAYNPDPTGGRGKYPTPQDLARLAPATGPPEMPTCDAPDEEYELPRGPANPSGVNPDDREHFTVLSSRKVAWRQEICAAVRALLVQTRQSEEGPQYVYALVVPRYEPFSLVVQRMAHLLHQECCVLEVSGCRRDLMVKVQHDSQAGLADLTRLCGEHPGSELVYKYALPTETARRFATVAVPYEHLLSLVNLINRTGGLHVAQVFDFY